MSRSSRAARARTLGRADVRRSRRSAALGPVARPGRSYAQIKTRSAVLLRPRARRGLSRCARCTDERPYCVYPGEALRVHALGGVCCLPMHPPLLPDIPHVTKQSHIGGGDSPCDGKACESCRVGLGPYSTTVASPPRVPRDGVPRDEEIEQTLQKASNPDRNRQATGPAGPQ